MTMIEAFAVMLIISVAVFLAARIYELLVMPLYVGKNSRLDAVLCVNGDEPELEGTVRSLMYLRNSGKMKMDVIIIDDGMDDGTKKTAELLIKDTAGIRLCSIKELCSESCNGEGIHRDKGCGGGGNIPE